MDYSNWKITDLKDKLREIGQPVSGRKNELIERLQRSDGSASQNVGRLVIDGGKASSSQSSKNSQYDSLTIPQLKAELSKYKLPTTCKRKEELIQRLESYMECQLVGPINFNFIGNRPLEIMMVAEKPSMALELANVLAQGGRVSRSSSSNDAIPIFRFSMNFHGYQANVWMTSTLGHVFNQDFGEHVTKKQIEELFEAEVVKVEAMPEKKIPKMLSEIGKGADALVLWLDCDLEGESICFEVIDCVKNAMKKPPSGNVMDVIYRAKFSSSDEALSAVNNLIKPNFRHHLSAIAKHDLDLRIGVPFSRYQTYILRRVFPDRNIEHLSFGPCQSPCLHFCVQQYEKLQSYVPVFTSHIVLTLDLGRYELEITSDPIKNEKEADRIYQKLKDEQKCQVVSVERTSHVKEPPKALNTVELLKDASKHYGIGPSEAMEAAEKLYTSGLISYPRTETTRYPKTLSLREKKNKLRNANISFQDEEEPMDWESVVESETVYERGEDKGDHPPIIPTGKPIFRQLTEVQKIIYELVCRRFFASWMPQQQYLCEVIEFEAADLILKRRIQEIKNYGFSKLLPWEKVVCTRDVPTGLFKDGSQIKIKNVKVVKTKSSAPTLLSESELIEKMEKNNIGTDASIPGHISNIQRRNYVRVNEDTRTLEPTKLGIQLIQAYRQCIPKLVETSLRAEFEQQIAKIAKGEREFEEARRFILNAFKEQFKLFRSNFSKFTKNFEGCFKLKTGDDYQHGRAHQSKLQFVQQKQLPPFSSVVPARKIIQPSRTHYPESRFAIGNVTHARSTYRSHPTTSSQESEPERKPSYGRSAYATQQVRDVVRKPYIAEVPPEPRAAVKRSLAPVRSFEFEEDIKRLRL